MITLEYLKEDGLILSTMESVVCDNFISVNEFAEMSHEAKERFSGTIVCANPVWFATKGGVPCEEADAVYSSDGITVSVWERASFSFSTMIQQGDYLQTIKRLNLKEDHDMADLSNIDLNSINLDDAMKAGIPEVNAFDDGKEKAKVDDDPKKAARAAERERNLKLISDAREKLNAYQGCYTVPAAALANNTRHGRLVAYFTNSDTVVKLAVQQRSKLNAEGLPIAISSTPAEVLERFKSQPEHPLPIQYREREKSFVFRSAKPGTIKGVLVGCPVGTEIPLRYVGTTRESDMEYDTKQTDLAYKVLPMDKFFDWLAFNFGNKIKEDSKVMGEAAAEITARYTVTKDKNGVQKTKKSLAFAQKDAPRKTIVAEGNYLPLKVYQKVSTQDTSAEGLAKLNLNVAAAVKNGTENFSADALDCIATDAEGNVTGKWFNNGGKKINDIPSYDGAGNVSSVYLPVYVKGTAKSGSAVYRIQYDDYKEQGKGMFTLPVTKKVLQLTGMSEDVLRKQMEASFGKTSGKKRLGANELTAADYLRARKNNFAMVTGGNEVNYNDMAELLETLASITA